MKQTFLGIALLFAVLSGPTLAASSQAGELRVVGPDDRPAGTCPLKHTEVESDIVGFVARTTVKQVFHNPHDRKIEAVYVFPLPADAAVDDMLMTIGDRRVVGQIQDRAEARKIYEAARAAGHVAGLLDQERPNIFTQSVANIEPGAQVVIEIRYVETLQYQDGVFEWVFPMTVGPRYVPGGGSAPAPMTSGRPTDQVPDADRITPPVAPPSTRAGHDISLTVNLEAGTEILQLESVLHEVRAEAVGRTGERIALADKQAIPNRDFILRYRLATDEIGNTFLTHRDERGGFFTLVLQPPRPGAVAKSIPRELVFVLDTSGSMRGFPLEKARDVMSQMVESMQEEDTFNVITFAGDTRILWQEPRPNSEENRVAALRFLASREGGGGTEMMRAIRAALVQDDRGGLDRMRIVCFMTDGFVGNDMAILDAVRKNANTTRVFSFGIGNSVNRYLLDGLAHAGRGEVEYVTLASQADGAVARFHERVLTPVLTDIEIDWGTLPVADLFPRRIPDLFSAKPIMVHGRLTGPLAGTITLRGKTGLGKYENTLRVGEATSGGNAALASLWARAKVADLMNRDLEALQNGTFPDDLKKQIITLGIEFRLMTQFTSFVAVEEMIVTVGGQPRRIQVPVELPEGVSHEGVFGRGRQFAGMVAQARTSKSALAVRAAPPPRPTLDQEPAFEGRPPDKLAEALRDLADKVETDGKNGNLTLGNIAVIDYKVDVMVLLDNLSRATLQELRHLGFVQTAESRTVRLLIGTIDVRRLHELAELEPVRFVRPVDHS